MKTAKIFGLIALMLAMLTACSKTQSDFYDITELPKNDTDIVEISLGDNGVTVNGLAENDAVYVANDIIYYEDGKDFTYGEGSAEDAHTVSEASEHTVVHITKSGTYSISGSLSKGQIAIDLGEDAKDDPEAVVTLILNGADITCEVAPAVIFYNVYECGDSDADKATREVDTSAAGANVIIADGTVNNINGSYVARIYKPDSVVLNQDKTEVEDAKKLHKYDAAFYSKMSMNIDGESGILNITAENEGLDSELHLTLNGGIVNITSGNDGINTNEDGVSVTTVNGGTLNIKVTGETGEGDGIDSNGWLVINGGNVIAQACSFSADAGIDSDMGIHINGGNVIATGNMLDRIEDGGQSYVVFNFGKKSNGEKTITLKNEHGEAVASFSPDNDYSTLIYSAPSLSEGTYTLWESETQLEVQNGAMSFRPNMRPDGEIPERPMGEKPEGITPPELPDGMEMPSFLEGEQPHKRPEGFGEGRKPEGEPEAEGVTEFEIINGGNMFRVLT